MASAAHDLATPAPDRRADTRRYLVLTILFLAMAVALSVARMPTVLAWRSNAFQDAGANLAIEYLTAIGDRPGIDNGYIYGLLCLWFGRLWCGLFGLTPYAAFGAWATANLLIGWGMARFAYHARVGLPGLALMLVEMMPAKDHTFVYILEPIFLIHALAEQARGRRAVALALVTACAFVKPSMASVFGLILLVSIFASPRRGGGSARFVERLRELIPASVVGASLAALFTSIYGLPVLIRSLAPVHAAAIYKACHFGFFFGVGRQFWYFPGVSPFYYLGTPTGFWLLGSLVLIAGAIAGFVARPGRARLNREVVASCALLHVAFVSFFFAHQFSYDYYYYLLVLGIAALAPRSRAFAATVLFLAAIGLVGNRSHVLANVRSWGGRVRAPETFGLFADPGELREWIEVRGLLRGRRAALLAQSDGAALFVPELLPPAIYYIAPTELTRIEIDRKLAQLRSADVVLEAVATESTWPSDREPVFRPALDDLEVVFTGKAYRVFVRPSRAHDKPSEVRLGPALGIRPGPAHRSRPAPASS